WTRGGPAENARSSPLWFLEVSPRSYSTVSTVAPMPADKESRTGRRPRPISFRSRMDRTPAEPQGAVEAAGTPQRGSPAPGGTLRVNRYGDRRTAIPNRIGTAGPAFGKAGGRAPRRTAGAHRPRHGGLSRGHAAHHGGPPGFHRAGAVAGREPHRCRGL